MKNKIIKAPGNIFYKEGTEATFCSTSTEVTFELVYCNKILPLHNSFLQTFKFNFYFKSGSLHLKCPWLYDYSESSRFGCPNSF